MVSPLQLLGSCRVCPKVMYAELEAIAESMQTLNHIGSHIVK